jgi:hypothetical protein
MGWRGLVAISWLCKPPEGEAGPPRPKASSASVPAAASCPLLRRLLRGLSDEVRRKRLPPPSEANSGGRIEDKLASLRMDAAGPVTSLSPLEAPPLPLPLLQSAPEFFLDSEAAAVAAPECLKELPGDVAAGASPMLPDFRRGSAVWPCKCSCASRNNIWRVEGSSVVDALRERTKLPPEFCGAYDCVLGSSPSSSSCCCCC